MSFISSLNVLRETILEMKHIYVITYLPRLGYDQPTIMVIFC